MIMITMFDVPDKLLSIKSCLFLFALALSIHM